MKCPYCIETIQDEALVCRYCRRDLVFFKFFSDRLSKVEKTVSEWTSFPLDPRAVATTTGVLPHEAILSFLKSAVAVAVTIFLETFFYWATWHLHTNVPEDRGLYFLSVFVAPFVAAIGLGFTLPRLRSSVYTLLGLLTGFAGFAQAILVFAHERPGVLNPEANSLLVVYVVSGLLSYLSGGPIGEWIKTRNVPQRRFGQGGKHGSNVAAFSLGHANVLRDKFSGDFSALEFSSVVVGIGARDFTVTSVGSGRACALRTELPTNPSPERMWLREASLTQPDGEMRWREAGSAIGRKTSAA